MSNSKHKTGRKPLKLGTVENYHHHWYLLIWLVYLTACSHETVPLA